MSIWAHVNASFRLDTIGKYTEEELTNIFGKSIVYGDNWSNAGTGTWEDYDEHPEQYLPCGSEGSLQISIWENPDKSCLFSNMVSVFGDLRDYEEAGPIEEWFTKVCNNEALFIRQAVCEVNIPYRTHEVYVYYYDDADKIEKFVRKNE